MHYFRYKRYKALDKYFLIQNYNQKIDTRYTREHKSLRAYDTLFVSSSY